MAEVRGDMVAAESLYRRAIELVPDDANSLGNLSLILIGRGEIEEAEALIVRAVAAAERDALKPLLLECWFYRHAVCPQWREQAEGEIAALLAAGVRSPGWDLSAVVDWAVALDHPDPDKLRDLAARISC